MTVWEQTMPLHLSMAMRAEEGLPFMGRLDEARSRRDGRRRQASAKAQTYPRQANTAITSAITTASRNARSANR